MRHVRLVGGLDQLQHARFLSGVNIVLRHVGQRRPPQRHLRAEDAGPVGGREELEVPWIAGGAIEHRRRRRGGVVVGIRIGGRERDERCRIRQQLRLGRCLHNDRQRDGAVLDALAAAGNLSARLQAVPILAGGADEARRRRQRVGDGVCAAREKRFSVMV